MMTNRFLAALLALATLICAPVAAQVTPQLGIASSGSCRDLSVRDVTLPGLVPFLCVDTGTHTTKIKTDGGTMSGDLSFGGTKKVIDLASPTNSGDAVTKNYVDTLFLPLSSTTTFGRSLVNTADAAAARTTLGLGTAATVNTGTSGATIPLLNVNNSWSADQTFTRNIVNTITGSSGGFYSRVDNGYSGTIIWQTGASTRWTIAKNNAPETGANAGSNFLITRFDDTGASLGTALAITRSSGDIAVGGLIRPTTDNAYSLGGASNRWSNVYATAVTTAGAAITGGSITGITDLAVADGGTGASTASAARTNLGLGSIATQDADSAAITGGSVTGLSTMSVVHPSTAAIASIDSIAGQSALLSYRTAGTERWRWMKDSTAEGGSNAGSSMLLTRYSDAGTFLGTAVSISRADGGWAFGGNVAPDGNNTRDLGSASAYWQRAYIRNPVLGFRTVTGDANFTLRVGSEPYETLHSGTLTANRTCNLSTTGAVSGDRFKLVRTGGGAFNLSFGGLKNLAQNSWAIATFDGSAWVLTGYGTL